MIVVTGGAGFIGSAVVWQLNQLGISDIWIVDQLGSGSKWRNLVPLRFKTYTHKSEFLFRLRENRIDPKSIDAVIHMGACAVTTEVDADYLWKNNTVYSQELIQFCVDHSIRCIYASTAATYGKGEHGYSDRLDINVLQPVNPYAWSKQRVDQWVMGNGYDSVVAGVKFFNVFGPNEFHKGSMQSMMVQAVGQLRDTGTVRLFRSRNPDFADGHQMRDFIYVKAAGDAIVWMMNHSAVAGLYNLGSGHARPWVDVIHQVAKSMGCDPDITYIDMPVALSNQYQYYTQADMQKLTDAGWTSNWTLESGIDDYVTTYLVPENRYLGAS